MDSFQIKKPEMTFKTTNSLMFLLFFLFLFAACDDKGLIPPPTTAEPEPEDYVQYGTPLANVPETKDIIMYEVNLRSFSESGDLQGVINGLDRIEELGVNVIWLMPIYPIGQINTVGSLGSPYSISDFKAVGAEFGTLSTLRQLVDEAHSRDMAVILDWVGNHTAWDHPWIDNDGWYTTDENGTIISPPGMGWKDVAELNFDNPDMRAAMIDALRYWVYEANVDGYRVDAADHVPSDFWTTALSTLNAIEGRELILLAEGAETSNFNAGFEMNYSWNFRTGLANIFGSSPASTIFSVNNQELTQVPEGAQKLRYITNHDWYAHEATPIQEFGSAQGSVAAFVLCATLDGVPLVYAGQEIAHPSLISFFDHNPLDWSINPGIRDQYISILQFRRNSETVKSGTTETYGNSQVVAFKKVLNGSEVLVLVNTESTPVSYSPAASIQNTSWTNALDNSSVSIGSTMSLQAYQYLILTN